MRKAIFDKIFLGLILITFSCNPDEPKEKNCECPLDLSFDTVRIVDKTNGGTNHFLIVRNLNFSYNIEGKDAPRYFKKRALVNSGAGFESLKYFSKLIEKKYENKLPNELAINLFLERTTFCLNYELICENPSLTIEAKNAKYYQIAKEFSDSIKKFWINERKSEKKSSEEIPESPIETVNDTKVDNSQKTLINQVKSMPIQEVFIDEHSSEPSIPIETPFYVTYQGKKVQSIGSQLNFGGYFSKVIDETGKVTLSMEEMKKILNGPYDFNILIVLTTWDDEIKHEKFFRLQKDYPYLNSEIAF